MIKIYCIYYYINIYLIVIYYIFFIHWHLNDCLLYSNKIHVNTVVLVYTAYLNDCFIQILLVYYIFLCIDIDIDIWMIFCLFLCIDIWMIVIFPNFSQKKKEKRNFHWFSFMPCYGKTIMEVVIFWYQLSKSNMECVWM